MISLKTNHSLFKGHFVESREPAMTERQDESHKTNRILSNEKKSSEKIGESEIDLERHKKELSGITFLLCVSVFGAICGTGLVYGYNLSVINNPAVSNRPIFDPKQMIR